MVPMDLSCTLRGSWQRSPRYGTRNLLLSNTLRLNGKSLSACDPDVLEKYRVGMIMNTSWDGQRLKAEAWLEPSRLEAVDSRVPLNAVQKGRDDGSFDRTLF